MLALVKGVTSVTFLPERPAHSALLHQTRTHRQVRRAWLLLLLPLVLLLSTASRNLVASNHRVVYLSTSGDDDGNGTYEMPFRTFERALEDLQPGDELRVFAGTYDERVRVNGSGTAEAPITIRPHDGSVVIKHRDSPLRVSGSHIILEDLEVTGSRDFCVDIRGQDIVLDGFIVHDCDDHGVRIGGQGVTVQNATITNTVLENEDGESDHGWGSALKLAVGAEDVLLTNNVVYENWGEGIAATRARNVQIYQNRVYNNFSVNIYVDNSTDVVVEGNFVTCTEDTDFRRRDGDLPTGIALGEEYYRGWGAKLSNVTVINNIVAYCGLGIASYSSEVGGGLKQAVIAHNTVWGGTRRALTLGDDPELRDVLVVNNIFQQPDGELAYVEDRENVTTSHNFWVGHAPPRDARSRHDRAGDVRLATTPAYAPESFALSVASRAIDAALPIGVERDFSGQPRQTEYNPLPDIGALEYTGAQMQTSQQPSLICRVLPFAAFCNDPPREMPGQTVTEPPA